VLEVTSHTWKKIENVSTKKKQAALHSHLHVFGNSAAKCLTNARSHREGFHARMKAKQLR
jgi:hypothetical protein